MNALMNAMAVVLCIAILVAALVSIRVKGERSLPIAILAAGLVSLLASVLFLILASPDVAMTEAAIGGGLSTFLFFFVLARMRGAEQCEHEYPGDDHD
jgi:energy-converting hydrogenase B subunit D